MLQSSKLSSILQTQRLSTKINKGVGVVYEVILDENNPNIADNGLDSSLIGAIKFRFTSNITTDEDELPVAIPFDKTIRSLPTRNETVEIYQANTGGEYYYRRIGAETTPNINTDPDLISDLFEVTELNSEKGESYRKVESTQIQRRSVSNSSKYIGFGDYFNFEDGIHRLRLYEGDTLIESRFGQSIRFSAYNNPRRIFSPTLIIRNKESDLSRDTELNLSTEEDVNRDGTVIALTSNQYELPFLPGTVNTNGTSDFETKPDSFKRYPQRLVGNQLLLNSDRVIISAKAGELIFYSKGNYGFISDGSLSIDNKQGININVGGNVDVVTNDRNINLNTGNGKINIGNNNLEPIVKGDTLVDILNQLIDLITQQVYLTPSGPTSPGPTNIAQFNVLKTRLRTILSTLNKVS